MKMIRVYKFLMRNEKFSKIVHNKSLYSTSATTIYALASGFKQKCGVAVIRLSGKESYSTLLKLTQSQRNDEFEPRRMYLRNIWHPVNGKKIDRGMVVWFKGTKISRI